MINEISHQKKSPTSSRSKKIIRRYLRKDFGKTATAPGKNVVPNQAKYMSRTSVKEQFAAMLSEARSPELAAYRASLVKKREKNQKIAAKVQAKTGLNATGDAVGVFHHTDTNVFSSKKERGGFVTPTQRFVGIGSGKNVRGTPERKIVAAAMKRGQPGWDPNYKKDLYLRNHAKWAAGSDAAKAQVKKARKTFKEWLEEARHPMYHSVFVKDKNQKWTHYADHETTEDARDDHQSITHHYGRGMGIVLRVPKHDANWHTKSGNEIHSYVTKRLIGKNLQEVEVHEDFEKWKKSISKAYGSEVSHVDGHSDENDKRYTSNVNKGAGAKTKVTHAKSKGGLTLGVYHHEKKVGHVYLPKLHFEAYRSPKNTPMKQFGPQKRRPVVQPMTKPVPSKQRGVSNPSTPAQRQARRAKRWTRTGVSQNTIKWMKDNNLL